MAADAFGPSDSYERMPYEELEITRNGIPIRFSGTSHALDSQLRRPRTSRSMVGWVLLKRASSVMEQGPENETHSPQSTEYAAQDRVGPMQSMLFDTPEKVELFSLTSSDAAGMSIF